MAEAGGNLSIMGWGVTLLTYAIASMAYAGLFTTEPWDTGGFGILSFLVFMIGIAFFIIGLSMQIFGGEEAPGRMPALDRFRNIFRRRGAPPAPRMPTAPTLTPGAPTPAAAQTLAPETPPPEGEEPPPAAAQTLAAPRAGLPGPTPKARLGVPLVSLQQLRDWDSIITQNLFTGKDYPDKQPILHHHARRIDEKINMLRSIREVLREIEQRQDQFQHVDWSELFTKDPRKNYLQFFNRIVTDFERVKKSTDLGELQKIRHQWRGHYNDTFNGRAMAIRKRIRDERTGRATTEEALKRLPPPKKEKPKEEEVYYAETPSDEEEALLREQEENKRREMEEEAPKEKAKFEKKIEAMADLMNANVDIENKRRSFVQYALGEGFTIKPTSVKAQNIMTLMENKPDGISQDVVNKFLKNVPGTEVKKYQRAAQEFVKVINKEIKARIPKAPTGAI